MGPEFKSATAPCILFCIWPECRSSRDGAGLPLRLERWLIHIYTGAGESPCNYTQHMPISAKAHRGLALATHSPTQQMPVSAKAHRGLALATHWLMWPQDVLRPMTSTRDFSDTRE